MDIKKFLAAVIACCVIGETLPYVGKKTADNAVITASAADYENGTEGVLSYTKYSDHIEITDCDESAATVIIPAEIDELPVTHIGIRAFMDCYELTEVIIPDSVTTIDWLAFSWCTSLKEIAIPDSVKIIGSQAFSYCMELTEITIPDSVTNISNGAFEECTELQKVTILNPNCVINDSDDTFSNSHDYDTYDGLFNGTIYGYDNSTAQEYAKKYDRKFVSLGEVPVEKVFKYENYGDHIEITGCDSLATSVVIPAEIDGVPVTTIGDEAFQYCYNLEKITIPNSIESIGDHAFFGCSRLTEISIPNSVTSIGDEAFSYCFGLTKITIPDSVISIGNGAFYECSALTEINIPSSVISIGSSAFYQCSGLTEITIPNSVTSIGDFVFSNCEGLTKIAIPNSVTSIGEYAFSCCTGLTEITIPDSVVSIGDSTFYGCTELKEIIIPDSVTSIGEFAFGKCTGLTEITIPESVSSIDYRAFDSCTGLTKVTISNGITSIDSMAFSNCTGLTAIAIPDSVTSIRNDAFKDCTGLTAIKVSENNQYYSDINGVLFDKGKTELILYPNGKNEAEYTVPDSVTSIGYQAFYQHAALTKITLPDSVKSIGNSAFRECAGLTEITILNPYCMIYDNNGSTISNGYNKDDSKYFFNGTIYGYENSTAQEYAKEYGVKFVSIGEISVERTFKYENYGDHIEITGCDGLATSVVIPAEIDGLPVTGIGDNAFAWCGGLTEITIPDSVKYIDSYAFFRCQSLEKVIIPDSVTSIGYAAFLGCEKLKEVIMTDSVKSIGNEAFRECYELTEITLSNSITKIGGETFAFCSSLTEITIPDSVTSIGFGAFAYCEGLTEITIPDGVKSIDGEAFERCKNLTEITIPNSVTSIEDYAFYDTPWLESKRAENSLFIVNGTVIDGTLCSGDVVIPDRVKSIAGGAFENCTGLTAITIPDTVTNIGRAAFNGCENMTKITIYNVFCNIDYDDRTLGDTATICGYENSNAHRYAADKNRQIEILPRPKLDYHITDSDKPITAKCRSIEAEINYSTIDNSTSVYTFGYLDRLQEFIDSKGNIYAIGGYDDSITLFSENAGTKPVTIENEGFTFGAAAIDDNDNLYVFWGYSISEDIIEEEQKKNTENLVVMKYDLNGNILGRCGIPITTSDAQYPFASGNASMAVKDNVIGCFFNTQWTKAADGLNHQGSEFAVIDKNTMELIQFSSLEGSHSFGVSLIATDYGFAGIQKGDGYNQRGINFNSYIISENGIERGGYDLLFSASGQYGSNEHHIDGNHTYLNMGGVAKSATTYAIAGKSERVFSSMEYYGNSDLRTYDFDVFLKIADRTLAKTASDLAGVERVDVETGETADYNIIWLTECNANEGAGQVKIVTLADGSYCVLWEKFVNYKFDSIRYVITDECGNILKHESGIYGARLSDTSVQPIVEGYTLKWAVSDAFNKCINFYTVDLNELSTPATDYLKGDVNGDGIIDPADASDALTAYAMLSTGAVPDLTEEQFKAADANSDGVIEPIDASLILTYYSYLSTGGKNSLEVFLKEDYKPQ